MSGAVIPLKVVQTREPRIQIDSQRYYAILKGPQEVTWRPTIATSFSNSNINFSAPPSNAQTIVDRKMFLGMSFLVSGTGVPAAPGTTVLQIGRTDAPRAFPISSIIDSASFKINNTNVQLNVNNVISSLLWYHTPLITRRADYSMTTSMLDQSQTYAELIDFNRNPLGNYGDGDSGGDERRGGFQNPYPNGLGVSNLPNVGISDYVDAGGIFSFKLTCYEPIFIPPFLFGKGEESGFFGVQTLDATINTSNLSRIWCHAGQTAFGVAPTDARCGQINTFNVTIGGAGGLSPTLLMNFLKPHEIPALPKSVYYPYFSILDYANGDVTLAPNQQTTITTNLTQVGAIPKVLYFYVRRNNATRTLFTTDTHAVITKLNITWNTSSGLLSSATTNDLYRMSVKNGCNMSWEQFSSRTGSVIAVDLGSDIGLPPTEAPGIMGQYMVFAQISFYNPSPTDTITYTPYMVSSLEGTMLVENGQSVLQTGVITKEDALNAMNSPVVSYAEVQRASAREGGDFFSTIKSIVPYLPSLGPCAKVLAPIAKTLLGIGHGAGAYSGGSRSGGRRVRRGNGLMSSNERKEQMDQDVEDDNSYGDGDNGLAGRYE
jgi:hypothetical protein